MFDKKKPDNHELAKKLDSYQPAKPGLQKREAPVIHTMPKRFLNASGTSPHRAKSMGLIILIGGILVLLIVFALFYYYIIAKDSAAPAAITIPDTTTAKESPLPPAKNEPDATANNPAGNSGAENNINEPAIPTSTIQEFPDIATSSQTPAGTATTSAEQATAPKPVITIPPAATSTGGLAASVDTDGDGLYDAEEALLATDPNNPDTDGDGYTDLSELLNLYNPAGTGQLIVNPSIRKYTNATYGYALYYPIAWSINSAAGDDSIVFQLPGNQFIQIIAQENTGKQSLADWYQATFGVENIADSQQMYKQGWEGIKSPDGLIVYLARPESNYIFTLVYNLGLGDEARYANIFEMMVKSLELTN